MPAMRDHPIEVRDVDAEPATRVRYGHKIPVLLMAASRCATGGWTKKSCLKP